MSAWIGIDPGFSRTGLVLRNGRECIAWKTFVREDDETEIGPGPIYWAAIDLAVLQLCAQASANRFAAPRIAIEGVRKPRSHIHGRRQDAAPEYLMGVAMTYAAVHTQNPDAVIVPPGGNGSGMLSSYPDELISARERAHKLGINRQAGDSALESHARSAWDVSLTAERMVRDQ
jgi:hypothetical protein